MLDIGFREGLEREHGFCRRHSAELLEANRQASGSLGSSILFGAIIERRLAALRAALGARGRGRRQRLADAGRRPPCIACGQGASGVEIALGPAGRAQRGPGLGRGHARDPVLPRRPHRLAGRGRGQRHVRADRRRITSTRLDDLRRRLDGFVDHSAQDRRHLLTDEERAAADEAARLLAGD